jgi:hypothetical protein
VQFERALGDRTACACIGAVTTGNRLSIKAGERALVSADITALKAAWQAPLDWS